VHTAGHPNLYAFTKTWSPKLILIAPIPHQGDAPLSQHLLPKKPEVMEQSDLLIGNNEVASSHGIAQLKVDKLFPGYPKLSHTNLLRPVQLYGVATLRKAAVRAAMKKSQADIICSQ
jgi:hypothetical protein